MKKVNFLSVSLTTISILFFATTGFAQEQDKTQEELESSAAALAKKSQNPVGNMISVPIEYWHYGNIDNSNGANVIMLKPVYPVTFGKFTLINRFIIPMAGISANSGDVDLGEIPGPFPNGKTTGLSNIQYQGFFTKAEPGKVIVGLGPVIELPNNMGSSQWSAGPALIVLTMPGKWVLGALAQNLWSFAGPDDDTNVNQLVFQYFANYNFNKGWYITSTPNFNSRLE